MDPFGVCFRKLFMAYKIDLQSRMHNFRSALKGAGIKEIKSLAGSRKKCEGAPLFFYTVFIGNLLLILTRFQKTLNCS